MFAFTKDATFMDATEDGVKLVGLVRKFAVIIEDVWMPLATGAFSDPDELIGRSKNGWAIAIITQGRPKDTPEQIGTRNRTDEVI
jgi:hypothetical protein